MPAAVSGESTTIYKLVSSANNRIAEPMSFTISSTLNPGPRFQCDLCKKYCKASDRLLECEECEKRFHASCSNLSDNELLRIESGDGVWYCTNCKADCGLCSGAVLKGHKAVRCDS